MPAVASEEGGGRGGGMSGGTIAALAMGALVVVGAIVAIILYCRSSDGATQQQPNPPTTHVNNRMFDTGIGAVGGARGGQLPSGAFVATTLDMKAERRQRAQNDPTSTNYSTPNIPTAAELQARTAAVGGGPRSSTNITYATAAPAGPLDAITYNSLALQANANSGVQYRPIYDNSGNTSTGVQYRPIYDTSGNGGVDEDSVNDGRPSLQESSTSVHVQRSMKRAKCERPSPKGSTCKNSKKHGSKFCDSHACPVDGCGESKSSSEEYCPLHANGGGSEV